MFLQVEKNRIINLNQSFEIELLVDEKIDYSHIIAIEIGRGWIKYAFKNKTAYDNILKALNEGKTFYSLADTDYIKR